jgi:hypothetical protein
MQTLPTEEASEDDLFWIDDRTLSKQSVHNSVELGAILSHLSNAGHIDAAGMAVNAKQLRRIGYSLLPVDEAEILATIEDAPIVDGELVTAACPTW